MPETPLSNAQPPPPSKPRGLSSPEAQLASAVLRLISILRSYPHAFPVKYDELKPAVWGNLGLAKRLDVFASDFFDDLLEIAAHPLAVRDCKPEHEARLREVALLAALRRLQAGDLAGGITRARRLAGVAAETPVTWPQPTASHDFLTTGALQGLARSLAPTEPATASILEELVPLLEHDPTSPSGASVGMLVHLSAGDPNVHAGYGIWMTMRCRAEVMDRRGTTTFSLNRRVLQADSPLQKALVAANLVSRSSRGPRLDRGLVLHLEADGLEDFVTGESADLAFALLFASEGRSAASLRRLQPHDGSAAIGEITDDGLVREVAAGPLRAKLRRVWESGVRRLHVAAPQEAGCREIFDGLRAAAQNQPPPGMESPGEPVEPGHTGFVRWVGVIPAVRLEDVALPHHFVVENRKPAEWIHRIVRRNRVRVEVAAAVLAAILVAVGALYLPSNPTAITVSGDTIHVRYSPLKVRSVTLVPERGILRILADGSGGHYCWLGDINGDGKNEILAVCLVTEESGTESGRVRLECRSASREQLWYQYVNADIRFGDSSEAPAAGEMKVSKASFEDWNGDGRKDIIVAMTNRWYPSVVTIYDGSRTRLQQYVHAGHVKSYCLVPASFVLSDSSQASGDWRQRQCLVGLAYHASADSGTILFAVPPWTDSTSSPPTNPQLKHAALPACDGPYVNIPPSLVAVRLNRGRSFPDHVEFVTQPRPYLKVGTIEQVKDRLPASQPSP